MEEQEEPAEPAEDGRLEGVDVSGGGGWLRTCPQLIGAALTDRQLGSRKSTSLQQLHISTAFNCSLFADGDTRLAGSAPPVNTGQSQTWQLIGNLSKVLPALESLEDSRDG